MNPIVTKSLGVIVAGLVFLAIWWVGVPNRELPVFNAQPANANADSTVNADELANFIFESSWVTRNKTNESHSASIVNIKGTPVAAWYGGTEEGHKDVAIFAAQFSAEQGWSEPITVTHRAHSEAGLNRYIRKVGNPALHAWDDGRLGLFYVTVSVGGWAASSINYMESTDLGTTWSTPQRIVASPFLNVSTLVRTEGHNLKGGGLKLPAYHEFLGKFSEVLQFNHDLTLQDKSRISRGKYSLQPALVAIDENQILALLRYAGNPPNRVLSANSFDGGKHWTHPIQTDLPNPNSAVALATLPSGRLMLALNDLEDDRYRLSLAVKNCGKWQLLRKVEESLDPEPGQEFEYSYPSLSRTPDGLMHLVYTWNQSRIKHIRFNEAWLIAGDDHGLSLPECTQDSV
ncbi:MAG: putative neuraminidase [Candidatus Azotimanducaceae bacterium]|jgi:predicted neuraminidase